MTKTLKVVEKLLGEIHLIRILACNWFALTYSDIWNRGENPDSIEMNVEWWMDINHLYPALKHRKSAIQFIDPIFINLHPKAF